MEMNEFIEKFAEETGFSKKDATTAVNAFFDVTAAALKKGDKVQLIGFGTFGIISFIFPTHCSKTAEGAIKTTRFADAMLLKESSKFAVLHILTVCFISPSYFSFVMYFYMNILSHFPYFFQY